MSVDYVEEARQSFTASLKFPSVNEDAQDSPLATRAFSSRGYITGFRDTTIRHVASQDPLDVAIEREHSGSLSPRLSPRPRRLEKNKLIIILVGLPGRGKTYLSNKLLCYLNWLGHKSRHFNVGAYRRLLSTDNLQDANFFDNANEEGMRARQLALDNALDDLAKWLREAEDNQVAVFDATNSTEKRRRYLRSRFHGKFQYMFIESICNDEDTLIKNYQNKMKYSPDYQGVDTAQALEDFRERIRLYEKVYEPMTDGSTNRDMHFIQLVNMVTGRGHMDINRISGYIPGKIVFFLMQVCKSGLTASRKIWLSRHGESEFNSLGKIGGDAGLTSQGQAYAERLPHALIPRLPTGEHIDQLVPVSVWTSTLTRTIQTAASLPFPKLRWKALDEIHAGVCDGMTYPEIQDKWPDIFEGRKKDKLRYRYPSGESYLDVIQRLEPVVIETERQRESVVIIGHQAILRVLYGYFMKVDIEKIPELSIPLHTLIELEPRPDGTMLETQFKVNIRSKSFHPDELFLQRNTLQHASTSLGSVPMPVRSVVPVVQSQGGSIFHVGSLQDAVSALPGQASGSTALNSEAESSRDFEINAPVTHPSVDFARTMVPMSSCASPMDLRPELHGPATDLGLDGVTEDVAEEQ